MHTVIAVMLTMCLAAQAYATPKAILLIGDSIRMQSEAKTRRVLPEYAILSPRTNSQSSREILKKIDKYLSLGPWDIIALNCGIHDIKLKDGALNVPLVEYEQNLKAIFDKIKVAAPNARVVWVTTTPLLEGRRHTKTWILPKHNRVYHKAAIRVAAQAGASIADTRGAFQRDGVAKCVGKDGVHPTEYGQKVIARTLSRHIRGLGNGASGTVGTDSGGRD